ncbi:Excinuclease ABC subunit C [hydrothermal vent metagenome]|uniref:Excinuclease ABC subunit C n=1 Tax=hydrothermal vent metagenome TaxID=652676 RepID=A0A1W1C064_9ZZZZ
MRELIQNLPHSAGVYQYFNISGKLLYIGKAKNLKNRVKSYWRVSPEFMPNPSQSPRILKMLEEAIRLEYILVQSEEDALILENSLIKTLNPKYNILLRDDKTYPYIVLDEEADFPRFELTRKLIKGKNISYYGPFPTGSTALMNALYEVYPLVQKKSCLKGGKACLFYQIKKCLAPCEDKISKEEYQKIITQAQKAIVKRKPLLEALSQKMSNLATQERFEEALKMRDSIEAIKTLTLSSSLDVAKDINLDIFAIEKGEERAVLVKMFMREGKLISSSYHYFRHTHIFDENDAYKQAILAFYLHQTQNDTKDIIIAHDFEDKDSIASTLSLHFKNKISLTVPQRGAKSKLIALAKQNCQALLKKSENNTIIEQSVAHLLDLNSIPYRIESFDNSHMMGVAIVGAMIIWEEGKWDKSSYRRYELEAKDEYAQMKEMLSRRIAKFSQSPAPDLWILDGGQANLNLALSLLKLAKVNLDVIAIAKEKRDAKAHRAKGASKDILYTPHGILKLESKDKRLQWIQRQRDESHRYAIAYHQNKKRKEDTKISLLNHKGIGKATVKKLVNYFGSFEAIYSASQEELSQVTNLKIASIIQSNSK